MQAKRIGVTIIDKKPSQIERSGEFGTKVYYGDGLRIDLLRTAGAETAKVIAFCNDNEGGELTREARSRPCSTHFRKPSVMVRAFDRRHLIELRGLDLVLAERELFESAVSWARRRSGERHRQRARSSGSSANIGCAIASGWSGSARPAISRPAGRRPSARIARYRTRTASSGLGLRWQDDRRARATIASTTSLCAPSPLFTWMCASA